MSTGRKIELMLLALSVVIAVVALVPNYGQWLFPKPLENSQEKKESTDTPRPPTNTPFPTSTSTPQAINNWKAEVSASSAGVYNHPSPIADIMATIFEGEKVELLAVSGNKVWVKINSPKLDKAGWTKVERLQLYVPLSDLPVEDGQ